MTIPKRALSCSPGAFKAVQTHSIREDKSPAVLENSVLTPEQTKSYEENGFLVFRNLVPHDQIDAYR